MPTEWPEKCTTYFILNKLDSKKVTETKCIYFRVNDIKSEGKQLESFQNTHTHTHTAILPYSTN